MCWILFSSELRSSLNSAIISLSFVRVSCQAGWTKHLPFSCAAGRTHTQTHTHTHSWMDGWFVALAESYTFVEWCQSSWQTNHNLKQHIVNSAQRSEWIKHSGCVRFSFNVACDTCTRATLNGFYRRFCPKWQTLRTIYSWDLNPWP